MGTDDLPSRGEQCQTKWSRPSLRNAQWSVPNSPAVSVKNHSAVVYEGRMYIFGGFDTELAASLNTLHTFDLTTLQWMLNVACQGLPPGPRNGHSATVVGHKMVVIGGWLAGNRASAEIHELNLRNLIWASPPVVGTGPGQYYVHNDVFRLNYGL